MEQKLTSQEIAKVFSGHIGCDVIEEGSNAKGKLHAIGWLAGVGNGSQRVLVDCSSNEQYWTSIDNIKLIQKNLSSISDEDAIEVFDFISSKYSAGAIKPNHKIAYIQGAINALSKKNYAVREMLTAKKYAVVLFFSPGHWASGLDAIQLKIAVEKI